MKKGSIEISLDADDLSGPMRYEHSVTYADGTHQAEVNTPPLPPGATLMLDVPLSPKAMEALGKQARHWVRVSKVMGKA